MMDALTFRAATPSDWAPVAALLTEAELPLDGAEAQLEQFLLAFRGDQLVASAGLEVYGSTALLRSVAVSKRERSTGLGREIVRRLLDRGSTERVQSILLLTTTAEHFFPRFGFKRVTRAEVPSELLASPELQGVCPASSTVMRLDLIP